jgi:hypothetical protein
MQFGAIRAIDIKIPPRPPPFAFIEFAEPRCATGTMLQLQQADVLQIVFFIPRTVGDSSLSDTIMQQQHNLLLCPEQQQ